MFKGLYLYMTESGHYVSHIVLLSRDDTTRLPTDSLLLEGVDDSGDRLGTRKTMGEQGIESILKG